MKTGFTNGAGRCLVTSVSRNGFDIIVVVLGADTKKIRTSDSIKLIEYTYKNYDLVDLQELIENEFQAWRQINEKRVKVYKGEKQSVQMTLGKLKYIKYPIQKNKSDEFWIDVNFKDYFEAPVKEETKIGYIKIGLESTEIMNVEILNGNKIERKGVINYFMELIKFYSKNR